MFGGSGASTHFLAVHPTSGVVGEFAPHQRREHHDGIGEQQRRNVGDPAQPVQPAPFVLNQDILRRRSRAIASTSSGGKITRFQATIGKLQTTLRAEPTARQMSATDPSARVRVNVVLLPGSIFSIVSPQQTRELPDAALHLRLPRRETAPDIGVLKSSRRRASFLERAALAIPRRH